MKSFAERLGLSLERFAPVGFKIMALSVMVLLAACMPKPSDTTPVPDLQSAQVGYLQAPRLTATTLSDRAFIVRGLAAKGARVRLSSPDGLAFGTTANDRGDWQIELPRGPQQQAMLFGLSEDIEGRIIQGEGYVALLPDLRVPVVLLRAGTGAQTLVKSSSFDITTADFDGAGGMSISGFAPAGKSIRASVNGASVNGAMVSDALVGTDGRFTLGLIGSARSGKRTINLSIGNSSLTFIVDISPHKLKAGSLSDTTRLVDGWRIDWTTPSGGVQTTFIQFPEVGAAP
jgi:hypothetical protein